eukprot:260404_1
MGACCTAEIDNHQHLAQTAQLTNIQFDLSIFNAVCPEHCDKDSDNVVQNCSSLARISHCLQYYSMLDITTNAKDQNTFEYFLQNIYNGMLNDYVHLIREHSHQLGHIRDCLVDSNKMQVCDVSKCIYTTRHHRKDKNNNQSMRF